MAFDLLSFVSRTVGQALAKEPGAVSIPTDEVASTFIVIGLEIAKSARLPGIVGLLMSHVPVLERDEETAVAVLRKVYASSRRIDERRADGAT